MDAYLNASLPVEERVADLLGRMTRREKVGQLNQRMFGWQAWERTETGYGPSEAFRAEVAFGDGVGALYGLFRADPWSGTTFENGVPAVESARCANALQRYVRAHTRLGIPVLFSEECPHGHQALDGSLMPVNLAVGATWNPALHQRAYAAVAAEIRARGGHLGLASALDVLRDPRWGRSEECFSEDPHLSGCFARAVTLGLQGEAPESLTHPDRVVAVLKHFCAQGAATGGRNAGPATIGERELREIHLPPMEMAVRAGASGCMAAYNEIDGVYCHGNRRLLTGILRQEWGFDGILMSDGGAIDVLDKVTGDPAASAALALSAGVDLNLWCHSWLKLEEAVARGLVSEDTLDEAVRRVLRIKFRLGLFEQPYVDEARAERVLAGGAGLSASLDLARESVVLLENRDGLLPFSKSLERIAVIGPNADDLYNQLGDYTSPQRPGTGVTVLQGLRCLVPETCTIRHARGCGVRQPGTEGLPEAVALARWADAVVLVLGTSSARDFGQAFLDNGAADLSGGRPVDMDCGEGVDVSDLRPGGAQLALAEALFQTGKPVVVVVIAGRPLVLAELAKKAAALLFCAYPGPQGGTAVAEILLGLVNPSGRLPVSLPRTSTALPVHYNQKVQYTENWLDSEGSALYPFGYGLGYAPFSIESWSCPPVARAKKPLSVRVTVRNSGSVAGTETVAVYLQDLQSTVNRRVRELKGFTRATIQPGARAEVEVTLEPDAFGVWAADMCFTHEPGEVRVFLCLGSGDTKEQVIRLVLPEQEA